MNEDIPPQAPAGHMRSHTIPHALGTVLFLSDWNWSGAYRSLERALEIDPDHTECLLVYGHLLDALGDLDEP